MKILHSGDWHIGSFKGPEKDGINLRSLDTLKCLEEMVRVAKTEKPELALVSGDIFDRAEIWQGRSHKEVLQARNIIMGLAGNCGKVIVIYWLFVLQRGSITIFFSRRILSGMSASIPQVFSEQTKICGTVQRLPDRRTGALYRMHTDWTGAKKHICKRGFKTQREAKEYEKSFLDQQNNSSDIMFSSLIENYLDDMSHRLKPTTMENKRNIIESKLLPYFSRLKTCEIDTIKIRKWQNELISYRDENGMPYSPTYLKTVNNQMSAILNYAMKHYNLAFNPCRAAGSIGRSKAEEMKFWTQEQYELFSSNIQKSAVKLAFDILFYTGIRSGELLALTPADILPDKRLSINKNFAKIKGKELFLEPKTPKSKRNISLPDFLYDDIQEYVSKLYGIQPTDRIFYFTKSALDKEIKRVAEKVGLPLIRVHDLRHSHASMLIDMGFDILEISERLGHESVKTTLDTYSHLYPEKDTKLAGELNKLRRPAADES